VWCSVHQAFHYTSCCNHECGSGIQARPEAACCSASLCLPLSSLVLLLGGRQCIGQRFALQEVRLGLVQLLQRFHYDIDWTLMAPSPANSAPTTSERGCEGDCSSKRALKTVNNFTLCPAGGIWVRLQPRVCPPGMKLL